MTAKIGILAATSNLIAQIARVWSGPRIEAELFDMVTAIARKPEARHRYRVRQSFSPISCPLPALNVER